MNTGTKIDEELAEIIYGLPLQDLEYIELETIGNVKKLVMREHDNLWQKTYSFLHTNHKDILHEWEVQTDE